MWQTNTIKHKTGKWKENVTWLRSLDDDLLLPYAQGHGPAHSHRHVRDCQAVTYGNSTHESWPSSRRGGQRVAESKVFVTHVEEGNRWVLGHMTVVHDPLETVSVLEPGGPGGCSAHRRASVEETAEAAGCLYAQNGGFFNTESGACLGNVVSSGTLVQDSGGVQNAQFGIRRDGTLVFGYLSEKDVLDQSNPFVQLVSGVVWLLRNGKIYINQSLEAECSDTQETGTLKHFVDVVSARTAVGHDENGRLFLFQIDGQTGQRGMNLWQVAEFLKKNGVVNAINLDGGGSATYVVNGSLASYPSDHCLPEVLSHLQRFCVSRITTELNCDPFLAACPLGFFGASCAQECHCDDLCPCDPQTGSCNATLPKETNYTLHRAFCLSPFRRSWLIITLVLTSLLVAALLVSLRQACRRSSASLFPQRHDYSYVPLRDINGAAETGKSTPGTLELEDSDSQEEVFTPSHSGRS
uniref:N-acetylglucosamine-1-phosphodiester alpha-N-acetylglucosaminidase n=1 Tax=Fundulus heteroclitus TaxID=8078 RepID=A0A3Q2TBS1_FUNHE